MRGAACTSDEAKTISEKEGHTREARYGLRRFFSSIFR